MSVGADSLRRRCRRRRRRRRRRSSGETARELRGASARPWLARTVWPEPWTACKRPRSHGGAPCNGGPVRRATTAPSPYWLAGAATASWPPWRSWTARRARATFLPERRPLPSWAGKVPCRDRPIAVATKRAARALQPTATARGRRCGLPVRGALASHEDRPSPRRRRSAACKFWSFFLGIYLAARPEKIRIVQIRAARLVLANTRRQAGQLAPGRRLVRVDRTRSNARAAPRDLRRRAGRGERARVAPPLARREFATPSAPKNQLGSLKRERERKSKEREREREEE